MCGIAGVFNRDGQPVDPAWLPPMAHGLRHRGPDADGVWHDGPVGFAHRRLSVLDLSDAGRQPLANETGSVVVCYNGEIYNFADLRADLESRGHVFRSHTDTEVIVHAWEEWGLDALPRFNGMFAFGLWDAARRVLVLARDRLGVKPLYVQQRASRLAFASELKALLTLPGPSPAIDDTALDAFLAFNYVPGPRTIWQGITSLPPGHVLVASAASLDVSPWWDVEFGRDPLTSERDAIEQIRACCADAVRARLVSDVPLGAFLSGGLDSAAVVAQMRPHHRGPLHTFSVRFAESSFDEGPYAALVARAFDLRHHEIVCSADDVRATLDQVVWHADNPTADISMVPMYRLAQAAREQVTVVLTGDGGDEVFGGYPTSQADRLARVWRTLPRWFTEGLVRRLVERLPARTGKLSADYALRAFVAGASRPPAQAHAAWRTISDSDLRASLLDPDTLSRARRDGPVEMPFIDAYAAAGDGDLLDRLFYVDLKTFLADSILPKVDRMTMAVGLEARTPWLDYRLVQLGARIPARWKLRGTDTKWIFKRAMRGVVPDAIVRRRKAGFHAPLADWFRGPLRDVLADTLDAASLRALPMIRPAAVQTLVDDHVAGRANHAFRLWGLVTLIRWAQVHGPR